MKNLTQEQIELLELLESIIRSNFDTDLDYSDSKKVVELAEALELSNADEMRNDLELDFSIDDPYFENGVNRNSWY